MREMKDSSVPWLGEVPSNWDIVRIKHPLKERKENNKPQKTENVLSLLKDRGVIPYDEKGDIGNKSKENLEDYKLAYPGDIVLNSMNVIIGSVGISEYFGAVSPVYYMLNTRYPEDSIKYLNYIFQTDEFQKFLVGYGNGILAHRMRIPMQKLNTIMIPYPNHEIQHRIAAHLDQKVSLIDNIIEKTKLSIEEYKRLKQSIITEAVTKGLNPDVKMKYSGVEWIGEIPEHWLTGKVKYLYKIVLGKMLCSDQPNYDYTLENYLCAQNIKWNGVSEEQIKQMYFSTEEKEKYALKYGDVVITEGGSVGVSSIYMGEGSPCYIQNAVHKGTGRDGNLNKILYYWMSVAVSSGYLDLICNKATIAHYTKDKLENTPIVSIPIEEQEQIALYLDSTCLKMDNLISQKEALLSELYSYKKSLIYEFVTGKREVM